MVISGGSGRIVEMPASTEERSEAGGVESGLVGHQGRGFPQAGHLGLAVEAPGQVRLELGPLRVIDRVDGVGAGQRVQRLFHCPTPIVSRRRMSPSLIRVLAVPTGRSSMVATSVCV